MSFLETVERARAALQRNGRLSLRALALEYELGERLDALVEELVDVQQVARRDGNVLVWVGEGTPGPAAALPPAAPSATASPAATPAASPSPDSGERRQLTVMFCDLVGSTELAQRLDPEELRQIVRAYREVCAEATKRFEGHVAQYLGDGVMVYFGYPQAHEDDAGRAIRAGLEIQRVLGERLEERRIVARIGIHTGLVVVDPKGVGDEALALGPTSNLAARIEGMATPGSVVVSDATLALCRGVFVTKSLGETTLKGVDVPVLLHEVERGAGVRSAIAADAARPMVGRERELGHLLDRWEEVQDGRGQVVLVSGDPGMGKSRLLRALRDKLADAPHLWLDMQCSPYTSGSAFQPLVDLFQTGLAGGAAKSREEASQLLVHGLESMPGLPGEKVIPYLLPLLGLPPSERYVLPQTSAEEQRNRTLAALVQLNHTLAARQPLVLVVEDLHWSDPSTLEYLGRLVEQAPTARWLLVLTYRPEFRAPFTQSHVSGLRLAPLSRRLTRELITHVAGGRLPEPVLSQLEARSDGVPLFIEELVSGVVSSGVIHQQGERYELRGNLKDLAIPATLQDSLMGRLDRLSASKHVAQQAATLGREFSYELIEAVTDLDPPALRTALGQLVGAEILHQRGTPPDAVYTFRHALLQDTAYESQLLSTRRALHRRIAVALEERFPERVAAEPERMARHCAAAGAHAKAVDHYQRAAELAVARLSNEEASEHYARALEALAALPQNDERNQREIALRIPRGNALMALRGYHAPEVLETVARVGALCQAVGEGPQQLPARIGLALFASARGDLVSARKQAEAILRIAEPLGVRELVVLGHVLAGTAMITSGSMASAEKRLSDALAIAEQIDFPAPATPWDQDLIVLAYCSQAAVLANLARPEQAIQALRLGKSRHQQLGHARSRTSWSVFAAIVGFEVCDPVLARASAEEALALAEGRGFHSDELMARVVLGWARASQGELEEGIREVESGLALAEASGSVAGLPQLYITAAHVYTMAKRRERAEESINLAVTLYERTGEGNYRSRACIARAQVSVELGDGAPAEAERLLYEALGVASAADDVQQELIASTHLARLAHRTGKLREAHDRLAHHYGRLTGGFDRARAREARAALDELAARLAAGTTAA
jgi:class 3 adenylate cyclase/tetratricopeptide (TPR) repeat protein